MKTLTICFYFYKEYFFFFTLCVFKSFSVISKAIAFYFTFYFTYFTKKTKNKKHPEFNFQIVPFHLSLAPKLLFQHAMLFLYFSN